MRVGTYQLNEFRPNWDFDADPDHRVGRLLADAEAKLG